LTLSVKKTEVLRQVKTGTSPAVSNITVGGVPLQYVDKFCYLGSIISSDGSLDGEISHSIAKASAAFDQLRNRLWNEDGVRLRTKIDVYRAVVLSILLYSCETWTIYRRHIYSLDKFHLRCLRQITGIKWQDKIPNTVVLQQCEMTGIETLIMQAQLRWSGHLVRMPDTRFPKAIFYSQLSSGSRRCGHPVKRYKDALKRNLQLCNIDPTTWDRDNCSGPFAVEMFLCDGSIQF